MSLLLTMLGGCGGETENAEAIHDVKYRPLLAAGAGVESGAGSCVEDTVTGLIWEKKTETAGLHHWQNRYSWYNPNENNDELDYRGLEDGGECTDSACDTWSFVRAVNEKGLCGFRDWRMPSRDELFSISDRRKVSAPPTANLEYFPYMQADEYWTGFDYAMQYESAWAWNFVYGHDRVDWKKTPKYVRLVRGDAVALEEVKE
ncbi:MAG: DUF1566 domain-containing protein [Woeseiaceae bacterium]